MHLDLSRHCRFELWQYQARAEVRAGHLTGTCTFLRGNNITKGAELHRRVRRGHYLTAHDTEQLRLVFSLLLRVGHGGFTRLTE